MCCDYCTPEEWHEADAKHKRKSLSPLGITWLTFARVSIQPHVNMHFFSSHDIAGFCADISIQMVYMYWPCRGGKTGKKISIELGYSEQLGWCLSLGLTAWKAKPIAFIQRSLITNSSLSRLFVRMSFVVAIQTNHGPIFQVTRDCYKTRN